MPERVLSATDVRLLAGVCVGVIHAYLSRGPSALAATIDEQNAIARLRDMLTVLDRELTA